MVIQDHICVISAVNNQQVLEQNLLRSHMFHMEIPELIIAKEFPTAGSAYNWAMSKTDKEILVFVHQDVYIPLSWQVNLEKSLLHLNDKPWAVLGIIGKTENNKVIGRTWSTGLRSEVGSQIKTPMRVETIDELLIVINKKNKLLFDERLPGFHLYGTDIVQTAIKMGYEAYVIDAPVIHNSLPVKKLGPDYASCYHYMQKKWERRLPLDTLILPITYWGWPLKKKQLKQFFYQPDSRENHSRLHDPALKAKDLGYEG